jgi:hypothetical protein
MKLSLPSRSRSKKTVLKRKAQKTAAKKAAKFTARKAGKKAAQNAKRPRRSLVLVLVAVATVGAVLIAKRGLKGGDRTPDTTDVERADATWAGPHAVPTPAPAKPAGVSPTNGDTATGAPQPSPGDPATTEPASGESAPTEKPADG